MSREKLSAFAGLRRMRLDAAELCFGWINQNGAQAALGEKFENVLPRFGDKLVGKANPGCR